MHITLADVPEEILERILALVLVQSAEFSPRPSWHPYTTSSPSSSAGHPTVISPLLVCRSWLRVATPIHYRHPVLRTARHADLLLRALRHAPALALCVRSLHLHATSPALRDLVSLCARLNTLDITVDNADVQPGAPRPVGGAPMHGAPAPAQSGRDRRVVEFCEAFARTSSIRHLVIRKNAYLTQPNATYVFEQLALAIARWHKLETVNVAFRLSPSPAASALTRALARAPRLHTLYTQLPAVWNTTLLEIAQNPALARIVLSPAPELAGAHLFLAEANRHPRLVDLIRAGAAPAPSHRRGSAAPRDVAFSLTSSARARATSAVPVPTWGYERDVPPPTCPPAGSARRPGAHTHGMSPHPHAYVEDQRSAVPYAASQYPHAYMQGRQHPGVYAQASPSYGASPQGHLAVPGTLVGAQPQRRAAGSRRMTAS